MRKTTLLAATALTLTCLGGQTLNTQAATDNRYQVVTNGNRVIIAYRTGCNVQDILNKLENCFGGITLPDCNIPGEDAPETNLPEVEAPEVDAPEVDIPETDTPEVDAPETDIPENNTPESGTPETDLPGNNAPDNHPGNGSTEESTPESTPDSEHAFIRQVVDLVNAERAKEGLSPLTINVNVQAAAMIRARECEQLFSHTRPDGSSFATALKEQNVSYRSAGENIAWGQRSPEEVMDAWMNSSGHRANIMNPNFTTIGIGYYENAKGTDYWCQLFTR